MILNKRIKHLRTSGTSAPDKSILEHGEIAIGYKSGDETFFIKNTDDEVIKIISKKEINSLSSLVNDSAKGNNALYNAIQGLSVGTEFGAYLIAEQAMTVAKDAQTAANAAQTAATEAQDDAKNAQTTANSAYSLADDAYSSANSLSSLVNDNAKGNNALYDAIQSLISSNNDLTNEITQLKKQIAGGSF